MARWFRKRWVWAALTGAALTAGTGVLAQNPNKAAAPAPATGSTEAPKAGDTITLKFAGQPEQKVTVVKTTRRPDGGYDTEVKDSTGKTFVIQDEPANGKAPTPPAPPPTDKAAKGSDKATGKDAGLPKAKSRTADPVMPDPIEAAKDRKGGPLGKGATEVMPTIDTGKADAAKADAGKSDPTKKSGLISRIFGPKKPSTPGPVTANALPTTAMPATPTAPTVGKPGAPAPVMAAPGGTAEPPRVMPAKPAGSPAPLPIPTPPAVTTPVIPVVPTPALPGAGLPTIPTLPGGQPQSMMMPSRSAPTVMPASYMSPEMAMAQDIKPYVTSLKNSANTQERVMAAKCLAGCRHASSDPVKMILFQAAKTDPNPAVKACCIDELCKLGYFHPAFMEHLLAACDDPADEVKAAAKAAIAKMTPQRK